MVEFNNELGKIGQDATPQVAAYIEKLYLLGKEALNLEVAALKAGMALQSMAQQQLNTLVAQEAAAATERQAVAVLEMAKAYPGMSVEVAKQLYAIEGQLAVAQQITGLGQINAQHEATINQLKLQGKTLSEAIAIADGQRAIALAQVNTAAQRTLISAQREYQVIIQKDQGTKNWVRSQNRGQELLESGVESQTAMAVAAQEFANAEAQRGDTSVLAAENAQAEADAAAETAASAQRHAEANRQAAAQAEREAAAYARARAEYEAFREKWKYIPFAGEGGFLGGYQQGKNVWETSSGYMSQFNPAGYTSTTLPAAVLTSMAEQRYGVGGFDPVTGAPNAQGREREFNRAMASGGTAGAVGGLLSQGVLTEGGLGAPPQLDTDRLNLLQRAIELLPQEQQIGATQQLVGQLEAAPQSLQTAELIKQLNDKLEQLTQATDANTSATSAMTDVLSPFYASDPRRTHLGFRAFAGGGIMTQYGELPLRHYQGGGMATSPQVAVFGEGSTPEAYVPVPSGRIPVEIRQPANSNQRPVNVTINVMGSADAGTVAALKQTSFQKAQQLRRITG